MKITALFVFVFLLFYAIPTFAGQFQPIKEITDFEKEIIGNAAKKPANRILKDAVEFKTDGNVVVLKFQNGDEGYYGYGEINTVNRERLGEKGGKISSCFVADCTDRPTENQNNENSVNNIFNQIFGVKENELNKADDIIQEYLSFITLDSSLLTKLHAYWFAKLFGNRYPLLLEKFIQHNDTEVVLWLYEGYIGNKCMSDASCPAKENTPSDEEKQDVIIKLRDLLMRNEKLSIFLVPDSIDEMIRINSKTYLFLKEQGKITR